MVGTILLISSMAWPRVVAWNPMNWYESSSWCSFSSWLKSGPVHWWPQCGSEALSVYVCTYVVMVCMSVCVCVFVHVHVYMYVNVYVYAYVSVYVCVCAVTTTNLPPRQTGPDPTPQRGAESPPWTRGAPHSTSPESPHHPSPCV